MTRRKRTKTERKKQCLLIGPIGEPGSDVRKRSDEIFDWVLEPAARECGYTCVRADQLSQPGLITPDLIQRLLTVPLVIADLTDGNANVFYELAVRHATGRPFVQIIDAKQPLPFNVQNMRTIPVDLALSAIEQTKRDVVRYIKDAERNSEAIQTPIGDALVMQVLHKSGDPQQQSLATLLASVADMQAGLTEIDSRTRQVLGLMRDEPIIADSVFAIRAQHYRREKTMLAEQFLSQVLAPRIAHLKKTPGHKRMRVIFDSGTTIAPMFAALGRDAERDQRHWCRDKKIPIVTNNIRGVEAMLRYRERPNDRYADLPLSLSVLPGKVLAAFEAIADEDTLEALNRYRGDDVYTIAITTGNYVVVGNDHFLQVARAGHHPHVKATLADLADEIYVVAPLGKLLIRAQRDFRKNASGSLQALVEELNQDLDYVTFPIERDAENKRYHLVDHGLVGRTSNGSDPIEAWMRKSVLVTTSRPQGCLFYLHSLHIQQRFERFHTGDAVGTGPRLWTTQFNDLPVSLHDQLSVEVPHENLRKYLHKYFFVDGESDSDGGSLGRGPADAEKARVNRQATADARGKRPRRRNEAGGASKKPRARGPRPRRGR